MGMFKRLGSAFATGGLSELGGIVGEVTGAAGVERAAGAASAATLEAAREAEALNRERYGEAQGYMTPYIEDSLAARKQLMIEMGLAPGEAGTAYMSSPGYKTAMQGVQQANANSGTLYSGNRISGSQQVQSQFYDNYMRLLNEIGNPSTATNLSSLGVGQAATMGNQNMQAQQVASNYMMGGAQAQQAARADVLGGAANIFSGGMAGGYI